MSSSVITDKELNSVIGFMQVGVAQQWYDELDNLAFSTPESELVVEDENATMDTNPEDERMHIDCVVNTSPGRSEVIFTLSASPSD